jgi:hypothetical protein
MRKTVSSDDDIVQSLRQEMRRSGITFKEAVNHCLRFGLRERFVVKPLAMGLPPGLSYDCIGELLEALEGPLYR